MLHSVSPGGSRGGSHAGGARQGWRRRFRRGSRHDSGPLGGHTSGPHPRSGVDESLHVAGYAAAAPAGVGDRRRVPVVRYPARGFYGGRGGRSEGAPGVADRTGHGGSLAVIGGGTQYGAGPGRGDQGRALLSAGGASEQPSIGEGLCPGSREKRSYLPSRHRSRGDCCLPETA